MSSDDESEDEEFTLKPLRNSMIDVYNELTICVENLKRLQKELEKSSVKEFLDSILEKAIQSGVKGVATYDFIVANLPQNLESL